MITWYSVARDRFRVRSWSGEEGIVYDMLSGDTHLIEPLALELLHLLETASPRSAQALIDDLTEVAEIDQPDLALDAVEASLRSMRRIGLVLVHTA